MGNLHAQLSDELTTEESYIVGTWLDYYKDIPSTRRVIFYPDHTLQLKHIFSGISYCRWLIIGDSLCIRTKSGSCYYYEISENYTKLEFVYLIDEFNVGYSITGGLKQMMNTVFLKQSDDY
ncbi:MAG TPA: hypothetical protein PK447_07095 [Ignavibacteria bacterium]|nr:hypothetical protein [Ignavibacteria bacterium]